MKNPNYIVSLSVRIVTPLEAGIGREYAKLTLAAASVRKQVHKVRGNETESMFHSPKQLQEADIALDRVNRTARLHHRMERL